MMPSVDWARLARRCLLAGMVTLAVAQLYMQATGRQYGYDFRGGTWGAGHDVLAGRSPFPRIATPAYLTSHPNGFITPPLLALLGAPFSLMSFPLAIVVFNLLCGGCLLLALRVLRVSRGDVYVVVLCSFPFISSLGLGQPDALFVLGAAAAWRWRDSPVGAVAAGLIIAAKLLAWPLVLWLLVTRRWRQAGLATASAAVMTFGSWAVIGWKGLGSYPSLLSADARAFETHAHSFVTALVRSGLPLDLATPAGVLLALAAAVVVIVNARGSDLGVFTAALTFGILSSPVVWQHYLLLLLVPFVASGKGRDPVVWVLALALWLSPAETPATTLQAWLVPLVACTLAARVGQLARAEPAGAPAPRAEGRLPALA